jgi:AAA15 family ATPase/GTPase
LLSHQEIFSKLYLLKTEGKFPEANYYSLEEIEELPKSRLIDKILSDLYIPLGIEN